MQPNTFVEKWGNQGKEKHNSMNIGTFKGLFICRSHNLHMWLATKIKYVCVLRDRRFMQRVTWDYDMRSTTKCYSFRCCRFMQLWLRDKKKKLVTIFYNDLKYNRETNNNLRSAICNHSQDQSRDNKTNNNLQSATDRKS